jgi:hypothetical protein
MILRPLQPPAPAGEKLLPAWEAVERIQSQIYETCWMITQPSHAALAGELAAKLDVRQFPAPDEHVLRAISLHDAGWGIPDAQAIVRSRSVQQHRPQSFVAMSVAEFLEAWVKSIETAESVSAAGGYVVSRHFWRLAEHRVHVEKKGAEQERLKSFLKNEERRQNKLAERQSLSMERLEELTDLLQFCDLLSLYFCSGSQQNVIFPEYFGTALRITRYGEIYKLDPSLIVEETAFVVAALKYPTSEGGSSRAIEIKVE